MVRTKRAWLMAHNSAIVLFREGITTWVAERAWPVTSTPNSEQSVFASASSEETNPVRRTLGPPDFLSISGLASPGICGTVVCSPPLAPLWTMPFWLGGRLDDSFKCPSVSVVIVDALKLLLSVKGFSALGIPLGSSDSRILFACSSRSSLCFSALRLSRVGRFDLTFWYVS